MADRLHWLTYSSRLGKWPYLQKMKYCIADFERKIHCIHWKLFSIAHRVFSYVFFSCAVHYPFWNLNGTSYVCELTPFASENECIPIIYTHEHRDVDRDMNASHSWNILNARVFPFILYLILLFRVKGTHLNNKMNHNVCSALFMEFF